MSYCSRAVAGEPFAVRWQSSNVSAVRIDLFVGGGLFAELAPCAANMGEASLVMPADTADQLIFDMFAVRLQSCADAATEDWRSPITVVQGGLDDTTHATNDTDDTNATNATSAHANASASSPVAENATSPGDTAGAEPLPPAPWGEELQHSGAKRGFEEGYAAGFWHGSGRACLATCLSGLLGAGTTTTRWGRVVL